MEAGDEMAGFDGKGQKEKTLVKDVLDAELYSFRWDGKDEYGKIVSNGLYLYMLHSENFN